MEKKYKYTAFISYRHTKPDLAIVEKLHQMLEQFKIPKGLDSEGKYKEIRIFRDRDELTTKDLSTSLDEAIKESEFLIIVCSKRTPLSPWCTREVREFKKTHDDSHIIPLLIEGEPSESFNEELVNLKSIEIDEKGNEEVKDLELLAADIRPEEVKSDSFIGYESLEKNNDLSSLDDLTKKSLKILKDSEIYRIMATILGVNFGDLKQRNRERRLKQIISLSVSAMVVMLLFGLAMTSLYVKAVEAERQASQENTIMTLKTAENELKNGDRIKSLLVANEAITKADEKMKAYNQILSDYNRILNDSLFMPKYSSKIVINNESATPLYSIFDGDSKILAAGEMNTASVYQIDNGKMLKTFRFDQEVTALQDSYSEKYSYISTLDGYLYVIDNEKLEEISKFEINPFTNTLRISRDDKYIFTNVRTQGYEIYSLEDEKLIRSEEVDLGENLLNIIPIENSRYIVLYDSGKIEIKDIVTGKSLQILEEEDSLKYKSFAISKDYSKFAYSNEDSIVIVNLSDYKKDIIKNSLRLTAITFNKDNTKIYGATVSHTIQSWILKDKKLENIYNVNDHDIELLKFDKAGKNLYVLMSDSNSIGVMEDIENEELDPFDIKLNECYGTKHDDRLYSMEVSSDDKNIITSSRDATIKITSTETNLTTNRIEGNVKAISSDGNKVFLLKTNKDAFVYDFKTNQSKFIAKFGDRLTMPSTLYAINNDGDKFVFSIPSERIVVVYNSQGYEILRTKEHKLRKNSTIITDIINDVEICEANNKLFSVGEDGVMYVTDFNTGELLLEISSSKEIPQNIILSKDGSVVAINYNGSTYEVFDSKTGQLLGKNDGEIFYIDAEDGKIISMKGQYGKRLFESKDGNQEFYKSNDERRNVSLFGSWDQNFVSNDGNYLLTEVPGQIVLSDLKTGYRLKTLNNSPASATSIPQGFLNSDNSKIIYDYDSNYAAIVDNLSLEKLQKMSKEILKDRQLTEDEKLDIGLINRGGK